MLNRQRFHHQIVMVGQVKDAITGQGISGAAVKIIDAPDKFINFVIFQTKVLGLPSSPTQWYSLNTDFHPSQTTLPVEIQKFRDKLKNPDLKSTDKLKLFQDILEDANLINKQKFRIFQEFFANFPHISKTKNSQFGRTQTISDGWFYFMDLPDGLYRLEASLPNAQLRYAKGQCEVKIDTENNKTLLDNISINRVELKLKPTTLLGKITTADNEAIGMARVQIQGSEDYTLSLNEINKQPQGEWNYRLVAIEARNNPITVIVSVKGYSRQKEEIKLQIGELKSLNFQLTSN